MNLNDLFYDTFILEERGNSLLLLDIDDTLVKAKNIFVYKKTDKGEIALTPEQYAKEKITPETKGLYDFREFRDPDKVANSIKTGLPIISNLKLVDKYINNGWTIGIITARGMEEVIYKSLREWLMYRNKTGNLQEIGDKLVRGLVHAINDTEKRYLGNTDFEKKANVIKELAKRYDRILLIDDDIKNINAAKKLGLSNVHAVLAKKEI
jgi:2-hydroxy-3-keto-5-methylthiopentenyl-1-phosphate phosphatase